MLEIKNVKIKFGDKTLLGGLSLSAEDGQVVCISGDSGCGKTSLLRAILGFLPLEEGHVSIDGELLTPAAAGEFRKFMAYVPQDLAMPMETVEEMVKMPFALKANISTPFSKKRLMEEWQKLDLDSELYDKKVSELSGGQRQRIIISTLGLLQKPIVLADEPTSALDAHTTALVLNYLKALASKGATVITVSHDPAFANGCDKKVII
ncbi:MAG: ABC transporter ATP-binding protein [Prevotella sp.]|nr:ABC transporter ATP-binding protein [Prevotella sp.]